MGIMKPEIKGFKWPKSDLIKHSLRHRKGMIFKIIFDIYILRVFISLQTSGPYNPDKQVTLNCSVCVSMCVCVRTCGVYVLGFNSKLVRTNIMSNV